MFRKIQLAATYQFQERIVFDRPLQCHLTGGSLDAAQRLVSELNELAVSLKVASAEESVFFALPMDNSQAVIFTTTEQLERWNAALAREQEISVLAERQQQQYAALALAQQQMAPPKPPVTSPAASASKRKRKRVEKESESPVQEVSNSPVSEIVIPQPLAQEHEALLEQFRIQQLIVHFWEEELKKTSAPQTAPAQQQSQFEQLAQAQQHLLMPNQMPPADSTTSDETSAPESPLETEDFEWLDRISEKIRLANETDETEMPAETMTSEPAITAPQEASATTDDETEDEEENEAETPETTPPVQRQADAITPSPLSGPALKIGIPAMPCPAPKVAIPTLASASNAFMTDACQFQKHKLADTDYFIHSLQDTDVSAMDFAYTLNKVSELLGVNYSTHPLFFSGMLYSKETVCVSIGNYHLFLKALITLEQNPLLSSLASSDKLIIENLLSYLQNDIANEEKRIAQAPRPDEKAADRQPVTFNEGFQKASDGNYYFVPDESPEFVKGLVENFNLAAFNYGLTANEKTPFFTHKVIKDMHAISVSQENYDLWLQAIEIKKDQQRQARNSKVQDTQHARLFSTPNAPQQVASDQPAMPARKGLNS